MAAFFQADQKEHYATRAKRDLDESGEMAGVAFVGVLMPVLLTVVGWGSPVMTVTVLFSLLPPLSIFLLRRSRVSAVSLWAPLGGVLATTLIIGWVAASAPWSMAIWLALAILETMIILTTRSAVVSALGSAAPLILLLALERAGWLSVGAWGYLPIALAPTSAVCLAILYRCLGFKEADGFERSRVNHDEYDALCEAVSELVMRVEAGGHVVSASANARRLFDLDPESIKGLGLFNRVHVGDRPAFFQAVDSARRGDDVDAVIVRLKSGEIGKSTTGADEPVFAWMEIRFRRVAPSPGDSALIAVARNITAAKELEQRLENAQAESVLAVALKDRMLANVSHELRTPLNAILGFSEMLGDATLAPTDPAKRTEYARIIHSSAEHLLSVVNLVLDMSRIEAGKFEIAPEPFELEPLIKNCCDMLSLKAENGSVDLTLSPMPERLEIVADKRAIRQILLNLVSNAVKFTPVGGHVVIEVGMADSFVEVRVSDTGIGIAAADLPRLGNPFFQVRSSYDRRFEGAGLGLSLVRGLVGLHGGSLLMESAEGVGTRVTVRLPADCRGAARAGGGASRLETIALSDLAPNPGIDALGVFNWVDARAERKIA